MWRVWYEPHLRPSQWEYVVYFGTAQDLSLQQGIYYHFIIENKSIIKETDDNESKIEPILYRQVTTNINQHKPLKLLLLRKTTIRLSSQLHIFQQHAANVWRLSTDVNHLLDRQAEEDRHVVEAEEADELTTYNQ